MATTLVTTSGPAIERGGDLLGILSNLSEKDVFFIDEIHRLPRVVEELLYPAMEDFAVNFVMEKGLHARSIKHRLAPFTLVGATTRPGMLSAPLRERFGIFHHLDFYSEAELSRIVLRSAEILGAKIEPGGAGEIARRARGTPPIVDRLLRPVRDYPHAGGGARATPGGQGGLLECGDVGCRPCPGRGRGRHRGGRHRADARGAGAVDRAAARRHLYPAWQVVLLLPAGGVAPPGRGPHADVL